MLLGGSQREDPLTLRGNVHLREAPSSGGVLPRSDRLGYSAGPGTRLLEVRRESEEEDKRASGLSWHIKGRRHPPRPQLR